MSTAKTTPSQTAVITMPRLLLHLEGAALLVIALILYAHHSFGWGTFALFLLVPDLTFIIYAAHKTWGTWAYNLAHTTLFPLALALFSFTNGHTTGLQVALIWLAHIGMDRIVGYGFKYTGQFQETHFSRI